MARRRSSNKNFFTKCLLISYNFYNNYNQLYSFSVLCYKTNLPCIQTGLKHYNILHCIPP